MFHVEHRVSICHWGSLAGTLGGLGGRAATVAGCVFRAAGSRLSSLESVWSIARPGFRRADEMMVQRPAGSAGPLVGLGLTAISSAPRVARRRFHHSPPTRATAVASGCTRLHLALFRQIGRSHDSIPSDPPGPRRTAPGATLHHVADPSVARRRRPIIPPPRDDRIGVPPTRYERGSSRVRAAARRPARIQKRASFSLLPHPRQPRSARRNVI